MITHLEERLELISDVGWILDWISDYVVNQRIDGVGVEGRLSHKQLIQNHPQRPQVYLHAQTTSYC